MQSHTAFMVVLLFSIPFYGMGGFALLLLFCRSGETGVFAL